ncbi:MAG: GNAT family N-acetyltransferase [Candidatus Bathyarchaeota archaeon]|nr:GNAT family N-acetyltransferase [Candidatus Bathyarchaeota archaeon]
MIIRLQPTEFKPILQVINDAAEAYKDVIPEDQWREPYMSTKELEDEIESEIDFYGWIEDDVLVAVMGIQRVKDVTLIRHAYVVTNRQRSGIGEKLLRHLLDITHTSEVLVGTWEAAYWAIRFYEKHGFKLVSREETERLLRKYWTIPERQVETSVVLKLQKEK